MFVFIASLVIFLHSSYPLCKYNSFYDTSDRLQLHNNHSHMSFDYIYLPPIQKAIVIAIASNATHPIILLVFSFFSTHQAVNNEQTHSLHALESHLLQI